MRLQISKDSAGGLGIAREGRSRYAWTRYWFCRCSPGERRWGLPVTLGSGEQKTTTLTLAGWHFRRTRQTDKIGEKIRELLP